MHKSWAVGELEINTETEEVTIEIIKIIQEKRLPFFIQEAENKNDAMSFWLRHRVIPASRDNTKLILDKTDSKSLFELSLKSYALSLSDQYWLKPNGDKSKWESINFFENPFPEDIGDLIFGKEDVLNKPNVNPLSPDSTTNGWLTKAWRIKNGKRHMIKMGSGFESLEPAVEVFASKLLKDLDLLPYVHYKFAKTSKGIGCFCETFLDKTTEFIPAYVVHKRKNRQDSVDPYIHFIAMCEELGIKDAKDFIESMNLVDFIFSNKDRHMGNFGFIRNVNTLDIVGFAPLFDNGASLLDSYHDQVQYNQENYQKLFSKDSDKLKFCKKLNANQIDILKKSVPLLYAYLDYSNIKKSERDAVLDKYKTNVEAVIQLSQILENKQDKNVTPYEKKQRPKKVFIQPRLDMEYEGLE